MKYLDLTDKKFGKLTAIKAVGFSFFKGKKREVWLMQCECGVKTKVRKYNLSSGNTTTCGRYTCRPHPMYKHGLANSRFENIFLGIKKRCQGKINYDVYFSRGIKNNWKSFDEFIRDMYESYLKHVKEFGEKNTTIDRKDNNGNYSKENCRWATLSEQANNKRNVTLITYKNKTLSIAQWEKELKIKEGTLRARIKKGINFEQAILIPIRKNSPKTYIKFKGQNKSISEWGRIYGIKGSIIHKRLKRGWSVLKAFNTPPLK